MALSETCIVERDPATYQVVTIKPLCEVFALVRYSDDPQRFTIEFSSGKVKRYSATDRYVHVLIGVHVSYYNYPSVRPSVTEREQK